MIIKATDIDDSDKAYEFDSWKQMAQELAEWLNLEIEVVE